MKQPKITLVGAGPGDGELITLKGVRALSQADVVLYDELVNTDLLAHAPAHAPTMYVGKRAGETSCSQEEINKLLVHSAQKYGHVIRLKGGDGYVFGRGYEEYAFARQHSIDCEVIPGISSCIAVPASQGIPVTCRGVSESFWVVTGTTRQGELSEDVYLAAQSKATVVVLMGMKKISEICAMYDWFGRGHLPMAVIQNGTRADERCVVGQVRDMPQRVREEGLGAPGILVIGEVVTLHPAWVSEVTHHLAMACS